MMEFFEITHLLQSPVSIIQAKTDTVLYLCVLVCLDGLDTRCGSPGLVRSDVCCPFVESGQIWRRNSISAFQGQETWSRDSVKVRYGDEMEEHWLCHDGRSLSL
jgi:hypothetical protein